MRPELHPRRIPLPGIFWGALHPGEVFLILVWLSIQDQRSFGRFEILLPKYRGSELRCIPPRIHSHLHAEDLICMEEVMDRQLFISPESLVERIFQFSESKQPRHRVFFQEMITGLLGSKSALVANVARFLDEPTELKQTEKRLCRMLNNDQIPWEELKTRVTELEARRVNPDDVIAFDPGDIVKKYALKMENLYRVHDGSQDDCGNGYEDFQVEAIQWKDGKKHHIPLYQKLINAKCEDYISQNAQICDAIYAVHEHLGDKKGVWCFDRGHDRSRIFEKALLPLSPKMRWIVRAKENRAVIPINPAYQNPRQYHPGLFDLARQIPLSGQPIRLTFPKVTGELFVGWERVRLAMDERDTELTVLVVHDRRNTEPVVLLSNLEVSSMEDAIVTFGYYLERWGKEEGYRFTKSFLNAEDVRMLNWEGIQNLNWLIYLTYVFVTLFYQSAPAEIDRLCEKRLKHFRDIDEVGYRYYRVASLMRILLWEQRGKPSIALSMTEVG